MRSGRVSPDVRERAKDSTIFGDRAENVQEVPCRAGQPIELGDQQHVLGLEPVEELFELHSLPLGSADRFLKHLLHPAALN